MMDSLRLMAGIGSRGGAETRRWGDVGGSSGKTALSLGVFLQRAKLGLGVPRGGGWSDDLMSMCKGERPVDCEG